MGSYCRDEEHQLPKHGILAIVPSFVIPYAELIRIHRPLGYYLNISPYVVGVAYSALIASTKIPPAILLNRSLILCIWSFLLRSGGCVWNDIIDLDLDRQIPRTKLRPLPRGAISTRNAGILAGAVFICAGSVLFFLPWQCTFEATVILFFALLYPFGKRFTNYPQVILFNIGWAIPMSMHSLGVDTMAHVKPTFFMFLFVALVVAMIDVVYSRQDTEDDEKVGVKNMAVHFKKSIGFLAYALLYGSSISLLMAGLLSGLGLPFVIISVGGHFMAFLYFLRTSLSDKCSEVESYAELSCFSATFFWVAGLGVEYCLRV